ncbi:MAG: bifunctional diguanylate cyclase/phosphodiesterase [Rubrivivax sp.]|nr:bifunctional diguanylate cyclase/phosphodiesterase [Rubrivivax sp.]MDP3613594.1 bifunctional diguanylate cyclase/phosphodiesterase [Rubrivivax sp.]
MGDPLVWALLVCIAALAVASVHLLRLARSRQRLRLQLHAASVQISDMQIHDPLTGLVSRAEFEALLESEVARVDQCQGQLSLLYVGLDSFRSINESYGLRVGDGLLVAAAKRLAGHVAQGHDVARVSSDEFVLLLRADQQAAMAQALAVQTALSQAFQIEALTLQLSASIGIACYPDHGSRPRLLGNAALAMRAVKHGGGGGHALYDPAMGVNSREQADLLQDLRQALVRHELQLYYQPKIDAKTLQITAAEALLRWQHPKRGMISPMVFVPLAERHGLIVDIGLWVMEEACRQAAQWREAGLRMRIAVNISGHQLRREDLVKQIEASLLRHHIPPSRLTCEITESVAMEDTALTRQAFERLRRAGLHVSIDDFGTGHSSLATLRRLPAAELKIDRAFVADLDNEASGAGGSNSIVRAIVQMAHSLHLRVVAEGVETEAQRDELLRLGCDELQGYLFARPVTAASLALWAEGDGDVAGSAFSPSLFQATASIPLDPAAPG